MKRVLAGILVFDMVMGMLCLMVGIKQEERAKQWEIHEETTSDSREAAAGSVVCEEEEVAKKIALTFDDDVIIGLSQEISYKEAVSMI